MVTKACDPVSPSLVKSLAKNRDKLDKAYQELFHDFKVFKDDVNDPKFNDKNENGEDQYAHNDKWFSEVKNQYFELVDKSDEKLEDVQALAQNIPESKPDAKVDELKVAQESKLKDFLENQMESERKAVHDSITLISNTVSNLPSSSISSAQAMGYRNSLHDISARLGTALPKLAEDLLRLSDDLEVTRSTVPRAQS